MALERRKYWMGKTTNPKGGGTMAKEMDNVNPILRQYADNPYVKGLRGNRIFYRGSFYCEMYRLMTEGISPEEAYKQLGFDTDVLGPNRAFQAAKRAKSKAENGTLQEDDEDSPEPTAPEKTEEREELPPEWEALKKNPYIKDIIGRRIIYHEEIYPAVRALREEGLTSVQAFEKLGIPVSVVGQDRANAVGKRAMSAEYAKRFMYRPGAYDGTKSLEEILEAASNLPKLLLISWLISRIIFLEAMLVELKKKDFGVLDYRITFVKKELKINAARMVHRCLNSVAISYGITKEGCLRIFGVARSSYEYYVKHMNQVDPASAEGKRAEENKEIIKAIRKIVKKRKGNVPGKRTMKQILAMEYGLEVGVRRVGRLMREIGLQATRKIKDPYKGQAAYNHVCSAKGNTLLRDFLKGPRQVILTDITYLYFGKGRTRFYLCTFLDAYTLEVLGWACSKRMDVSLVEAAYGKMLAKYQKEFDVNKATVYVHSDQGSVYLSTTFTQLLSDIDFAQSVSRRGNSQDNAPQESYFGTFKSYIMTRLPMCKNYQQALTMVDDCINFCNTGDRREVLGYLTPYEFFALHATGIYTLDEQYGVPADQLRSPAELIEAYQSAKEKNPNATRKFSTEEQKEVELNADLEKTVLSQDPGAVMRRDMRYAEIRKEKAVKNKEKADENLKKAEAELKASDELVSKIASAMKWFAGVSAKVKEDLKLAQHWRKYPELNYVNDMDGMF